MCFTWYNESSRLVPFQCVFVLVTKPGETFCGDPLCQPILPFDTSLPSFSAYFEQMANYLSCEREDETDDYDDYTDWSATDRYPVSVCWFTRKGTYSGWRQGAPGSLRPSRKPDPFNSQESRLQRLCPVGTDLLVHGNAPQQWRFLPTLLDWDGLCQECTGFIPCQYITLLQETIKMTYEYSHYERHWWTERIPWNEMAVSSARIHADVVRIDCQASSERMKEVVSLFEQYKTTADTLQIME